jgi:hypothetical protein
MQRDAQPVARAERQAAPPLGTRRTSCAGARSALSLGTIQRALTVAAKQKSQFAGVWRITEMEQWDRDYIDLHGPGFIKFEKGASGTMRFGAVEVGLDCASAAFSSRRALSHSASSPRATRRLSGSTAR